MGEELQKADEYLQKLGTRGTVSHRSGLMKGPLQPEAPHPGALQRLGLGSSARCGKMRAVFKMSTSAGWLRTYAPPCAFISLVMCAASLYRPALEHGPPKEGVGASAHQELQLREREGASAGNFEEQERFVRSLYCQK